MPLAPPSTITPTDAQHSSWDAVVVGAGPAGAVAALQLARAGLRTLLLDRTPPPRSKVCGCCLAPSGALALQQLNLATVLHDAAPISLLRIHAHNRSATLPIPGYLAIARDTLDSRLIEHARNAGAQLLWNASARALTTGDLTITANSHTYTLHPSVVIIADGLAGLTLSNPSIPPPRIHPHSRMGAAAILDSPPIPLESHEILMLVAPEGYLGLVKLPSGACNLAGAFIPAALRNARGPATLAAQLLALSFPSLDTLPILNAHWKATPLLTRSRRSLEHGRLLLVGDTAGFVEPFTGEGVSWAIRSAAAAAEYALSIARNGTTQTSKQSPTTTGWTSRHARLLRRRHLLCALASRALRSPRLISAALRLANASPTLAALLARPFSSHTRSSPLPITGAETA